MKSGWLFTTGNGKQAATLGKQLCVELLQELHKFGWDLELSSDLARSRHQGRHSIPSQKLSQNVSPKVSQTI